MIKLIIFDLDGTLLNTIEDLANSTNHALKVFDFPTHPTEEYRFFVGNGINKLLERALPELHRTPDTISMIKFEFIKHYSQHAETYTRPYDGIEELLQTLEKKGYILSVASNKMHSATVALVNRFFPNIYFRSILGQRDGAPAKPNPMIVNDIVSTVGVKKSEVLYVGDSGVDVATAINSEVLFVGVLWGFRPRNELEQLGAQIFINHPRELLPIIEQNQ